MTSFGVQDDPALLEGHDPTRLQGGQVSGFAGWKRAWWILLTLVPFGWLSFVAFFYIGQRARYSRWKWWAGVYFVLAWAATLVASVEELSEPVRQTGGMVMLFVAWPVPFIHALRARRSYLDRTSRAGTTDEAAVLTPANQVQRGTETQWRGKRRSPWLAVGFVFFSLFGAAQVVAGRGADRIWGLFSLLFFGLGGAAVYAPKAKSSGGIGTGDVSHRGRYQLALVIEIDRRRHRVRTIASIGMGIAGGLVASYADVMTEPGSRYSPGSLRVVGLMLLIFAGGGGLLALRKWTSVPRLILLSDGVLMEVGATSTYVPWSAIESVGVFSMRGNDMLGIRVGDRSQVEAGRVARALLPVSRFLSPADLSQALDAFVAEPEVVVSTIDHYFSRPEERELLASGEGKAVRSRP